MLHRLEMSTVGEQAEDASYRVCIQNKCQQNGENARGRIIRKTNRTQNVFLVNECEEKKAYAERR